MTLLETVRSDLDDTKVAYRKPQPFGMQPDIFLGDAMNIDGDEDEWAPQGRVSLSNPSC
jgi:2,4'-dihydroxyacetophenone dioxygenase